MRPDSITHSGEWIFFLHPDRTEIHLQDLYYASSNIRRWNGHLDFSLLKHLTLCVLLAKENDYSLEEVAHCAAHDLHEIYVGDVVTGLKKYIPQFIKIEKEWEYYLHDYFNLPNWDQSEFKTKTKIIDSRSLCLESTLFKDNRVLDLMQELFPNDPLTKREIELLKYVISLENETAWNIVFNALSFSKNLYYSSL
jgi:hypothetical protein